MAAVSATNASTSFPQSLLRRRERRVELARRLQLALEIEAAVDGGDRLLGRHSGGRIAPLASRDHRLPPDGNAAWGSCASGLEGEVR
jgi:hypothetical protein